MVATIIHPKLDQSDFFISMLQWWEISNQLDNIYTSNVCQKYFSSTTKHVKKWLKISNVSKPNLSNTSTAMYCVGLFKNQNNQKLSTLLNHSPLPASENNLARCRVKMTPNKNTVGTKHQTHLEIRCPNWSTYNFNHINHYLFNINYASYNKIYSLVLDALWP